MTLYLSCSQRWLHLRCLAQKLWIWQVLLSGPSSMPSGQEQITPSPGTTVQLWLQSPLSIEHRSAGRKKEEGLERRVQVQVQVPSKLAFLVLTTQFFVGAVRAVVEAVAEFLGGQAYGGVVGAHMMGQLARQRLAVILV